MQTSKVTFSPVISLPFLCGDLLEFPAKLTNCVSSFFPESDVIREFNLSGHCSNPNLDLSRSVVLAELKSTMRRIEVTADPTFATNISTTGLVCLLQRSGAHWRHPDQQFLSGHRSRNWPDGRHSNWPWRGWKWRSTIYQQLSQAAGESPPTAGHRGGNNRRQRNQIREEEDDLLVNLKIKHICKLLNKSFWV